MILDELQPWIIDIDEVKFRALWQKIGGNQEQVPSVLLEEYPDEEMRTQDEKEKQRTLGLHDDNKIHIFYKNFPDITSYKDKGSFHKKIVNTLAHEVSHARLNDGNAGIHSLLHNFAQWILDFISQYLFTFTIIIFTLFLGLIFFGFTSYISFPHAITLLIISLPSFLATCTFIYFLSKLSVHCREAITDSYAADLLSMHEDDLMDMVHVVTLTDLFPKTAHGQFLLGYHSAAIAAKNLQQKSLN